LPCTVREFHPEMRSGLFTSCDPAPLPGLGVSCGTTTGSVRLRRTAPVATVRRPFGAKGTLPSTTEDRGTADRPCGAKTAIFAGPSGSNALPRASRRRAAAAVEFALVSLPLFLLLLGLIDYGWIFLKAQQITQAARAGARAAALPNATLATVDREIDDWMEIAGIEDYRRTIEPANWASGLLPGCPVTVKVVVDSDEVALIQSNLVPVPNELRATANMAKEGPGEPGACP